MVDRLGGGGRVPWGGAGGDGAFEDGRGGILGSFVICFATVEGVGGF